MFHTGGTKKSGSIFTLTRTVLPKSPRIELVEKYGVFWTRKKTRLEADEEALKLMGRGYATNLVFNSKMGLWEIYRSKKKLDLPKVKPETLQSRALKMAGLIAEMRKCPKCKRTEKRLIACAKHKALLKAPMYKILVYKGEGPGLGWQFRYFNTWEGADTFRRDISYEDDELPDIEPHYPRPRKKLPTTAATIDDLPELERMLKNPDAYGISPNTVSGQKTYARIEAKVKKLKQAKKIVFQCTKCSKRVARDAKTKDYVCPHCGTMTLFRVKNLAIRQPQNVMSKIGKLEKKHEEIERKKQRRVRGMMGTYASKEKIMKAQEAVKAYELQQKKIEQRITELLDR